MIEIRDLRVRFGDLVAVDGLSLTVTEGLLYGLLGPNGAGKTTTLSCVAGLRTPTGGTVRVGGLDPVRQPMEVRRLLGLVPQSLALYPTLTVTDNLRIFGGLMGLSGARLRDRVAWGLALAQLDGRAGTIVDTLSGGMKRRLNLACALLHDPRLVICDEPTTGVDPQSRNHLFETIRALREEGRTVVYTTHYMEEVEALCRRVAIVDHGRLVADAPLGELLARAGATSHFDVTLSAAATPEQLRAALAAAGLNADVQAGRSLEDVFLELTGHALRDDA
ncbi:MAG: hypothetical protein AMXMBFR64_25030 [Myxococcales bacterium]